MIETDIVVIGSGVAGLTASLVAASEGLKVVLCEKSSLIGGTTARSAGTLWAPGSPPIVRNGRDEPRERVDAYLKHELRGHYRPDMVKAFLDAIPKAVAYLESHSEVQFLQVENPDYHSDAPGGSAYGRAIAPLPFDGSLLGEDFELLRPPLDIHLILGGMMVGRREVPMLLRPFSSMLALRSTAKILAQHALARLRHRRGTRLLLGNALVARFLLSLRRLGVAIRTGSTLKKLVLEQGRVVAVEVLEGGHLVQISARRAVILAAGGMAHDKELRSAWMENFPHEHSLVCETNAGEAVLAAQNIGAAIDSEVASPAFWSPASLLEGSMRQTVWIHGHMDRGKPGLMAVDVNGRRFVNESDSYHDFVTGQYGSEEAHAARRIPAYLICDHRFIRSYGLGMVMPIYGRLESYVKKGYLVKARTIRELAGKISVDPGNLEKTIGKYNEDANLGLDSLFGRGGSAFNRFNGDPGHQPNPCMRALDQPPYYAVKVYPCSIGIALGLATDINAGVLDVTGVRIPGLYACGNDMTSVMRGYYPGPGIMLGPAVAFAYRAVMDVLEKPCG
jgi:3-oxosteroid 1-dehydrogenase